LGASWPVSLVGTTSRAPRPRGHPSCTSSCRPSRTVDGASRASAVPPGFERPPGAGARAWTVLE